RPRSLTGVGILGVFVFTGTTVIHGLYEAWSDWLAPICFAGAMVFVTDAWRQHAGDRAYVRGLAREGADPYPVEFTWMSGVGAVVWLALAGSEIALGGRWHGPVYGVLGAIATVLLFADRVLNMKRRRDWWARQGGEKR